MRVACDVYYIDITNDEGYEVEGVMAECPRCGAVTESYGNHEGSIKRCLAAFSDECTRGENNWYVEVPIEPKASEVVDKEDAYLFERP